MKEGIVIIGAGPAGMTCAMELAKSGRNCLVVEKDSKVGGLAKTLEFKEGDLLFRTDIGPHRFFSKNRRLYEFVEGLLGEKWMSVRRRTRQYIDGKYYDYPIKPVQAFLNIGPLRAIKMGLSYLEAVARYRILGKKILSFEDYIDANFGHELGAFNMLNYTEKIWGIPCSRLHPDWARQRIRGLNLVSAAANALLKNFAGSGPKTLVDAFYYPQYGTGLIYETIADRIKESGSVIELESSPEKITHDGGKIVSLALNVHGRQREIEPGVLVTSMPINELVGMLDPPPPAEVLQAVAGLKWRSQVYLFITLDQEKVTDDNWVYFPDRGIPFGRVAEMKNFSPDMSPPGKTSLFVEFFVSEGDPVWGMAKGEVFELAMGQFEKMKMLDRSAVRAYYVFRRRFVYPVYDLQYRQRLETVKKYLDRFSNMHYIGRPGRFQYTNQDHSIEMGMAAAKCILENGRCDFDLIGSEKEYFEKGILRDSAEKPDM